MSSPNRKVLGLSAALAAITGPGLVATTASAADTGNPAALAAGTSDPTLIINIGDEFMTFTVGTDASGTVVADHSSHASHSSHSSHSSHYSSR